MDEQNTNRTLSFRADSKHFDLKAQKFREFFGIKYSENLGDVFQQFYKRFNIYTPLEVNLQPTVMENRLILNRLNQNDGECCYALKRNSVVDGKQYHRTVFNAEKCRRLKPDLYTHYEKEDTISFCFRWENELDAGIMGNFAEREMKKMNI